MTDTAALPESSIGALAGLRVLDFSRLLPGPYCTWLLADQGAEVIRIENPRELNKQAKIFGWDRLSETQRKRQREQDNLARNKESMQLDIGNADAQALIRKMIADVDVLVEDYRPGVLESLGLGYEALSQINPGLIYCSLTLCGHSGPYRNKPGHDPIALAISGVMSRLGDEPERPGFAGIPAADISTGTHAAFAIMAALFARQRDQLGQFIDIAMSDCSMTFLINLLSRHTDPDHIPPKGSHRNDLGLWRTSDGYYICTTDMEPRYWQRFCEVLNRPDLISKQLDQTVSEALREDIAALFAERTRAEWIDILSAADTQFAAVNTVSEALADPHVQAREMVCNLTNDRGETLRQLGSPIKLGRTPARVRSLAVLPGADTQRILTRFGQTEADIEALHNQGAFG